MKVSFPLLVYMMDKEKSVLTDTQVRQPSDDSAGPQASVSWLSSAADDGLETVIMRSLLSCCSLAALSSTVIVSNMHCGDRRRVRAAAQQQHILSWLLFSLILYLCDMFAYMWPLTFTLLEKPRECVRCRKWDCCCTENPGVEFSVDHLSLKQSRPSSLKAIHAVKIYKN